MKKNKRLKNKPYAYILVFVIVLVISLYTIGSALDNPYLRGIDKKWWFKISAAILSIISLLFAVNENYVTIPFIDAVAKFLEKIFKHIPAKIGVTPRDSDIKEKQKNEVFQWLKQGHWMKEGHWDFTESQNKQGVLLSHDIPFTFSVFRKKKHTNAIDAFIKKDEIDSESNHEIDFYNKGMSVNYLIVGEAGCGKSFCLSKGIQSYLDAIDRRTSSYKLPFYVNLAEWNDDYYCFADWLKNYFYEKIGKKYYWIIDRQQLIPFLDGFDEIPIEKRESCFMSILEFSADNSLVLSSRNEEFKLMIEHLNKNKRTIPSINSFVVFEIEPLTPEVIKEAVDDSRHKNAKEIIELMERTGIFEPEITNKKPAAVISEYAKSRTPLITKLLILVYVTLDPTELNEMKLMNAENVTNLLWKKYDEFMFEEQLKDKNIDKKRLRTRIVWLSKFIEKGSLFTIDLIQPVFFSKLTKFKKTGRLLYYFISRIFSGLLLSVAIGLVFTHALEFLANAVFLSVILVLITLCSDKGKPLQSSVSFNNADSVLKKIIGYKKQVLSFIMFFGLLGAAFQGFCVPHGDSTCLLGYTKLLSFSISEAIPGAMFGIFFGAIFGYRNAQQTDDNDILAIQKFIFKRDDLANALKNSWRGSLFIGVFIGFIGVILHLFFEKECTFVQHYLVSLADNSDSNSLTSNVRIFLLASLLGIVFGSFLITLIKIFNPDKLNDDIKKPGFKFGLNKGIIFTLLNAVRISVTPFLISAGLFIFILFIECGVESESIIRGLRIGLGFGLISVLLLGGFEVINHWSIRILLYLFGVLPLSFTKLIKDSSNLNLFHKVSGSLSFVHETLVKYYREELDMDDASKITKTSYLSYIPLLTCILFICFSLIIIHPFQKRNTPGFYWADNQKGIELTGNAYHFKIDRAENKVLILKPGVLKITVDGKIKLGTFVGRSSAYGTNLGFLTFPLKDHYNLVKNPCRHGALLYFKDTKWCPVVTQENIWGEMRTQQIKVKQGDFVCFLVNDAEYENNIGSFKLHLKLDTIPPNSSKP